MYYSENFLFKMGCKCVWDFFITDFNTVFVHDFKNVTYVCVFGNFNSFPEEGLWIPWNDGSLDMTEFLLLQSTLGLLSGWVIQKEIFNLDTTQEN